MRARVCVCMFAHGFLWAGAAEFEAEYGGAQVAAMNKPQCVRAPGPKASRAVAKMVSAAAAHLLFALVYGEFLLKFNSRIPPPPPQNISTDLTSYQLGTETIITFLLPHYSSFFAALPSFTLLLHKHNVLCLVSEVPWFWLVGFLGFFSKIMNTPSCLESL